MTITLWDVTIGKERVVLRRQESDFSFNCMAFSPDGKTLAVGGGGLVRLWDVAAGTIAAILDADSEDLERVVFSPDSKTLAIIEHRIDFWDLASGKQTATDAKDNPEPRPRLFREFKRFLDKHPNVKDAVPGCAEEHRDVQSVFFTPNGKIMALGYDDRESSTVMMWQVSPVPIGRK